MSGFVKVALLLSHCVCVSVSVVQDTLELKSVSGGNCSLQCTADYKPGVQYRAVRWYKITESSHRRGLLIRDLPNGPTSRYSGVGREVALLGESDTILLPNVTCADSGWYECHLAASVGEQNREGRVLLTLTDCPDSSSKERRTDTSQEGQDLLTPTDFPDRSAENLMTDTYLEIFALAVLMVALLIFLISYGILKNIISDKSQMTKKEVLLDAPLKPLDRADLTSIYTLGPKSKNPSMKHVYV